MPTWLILILIVGSLHLATLAWFVSQLLSAPLVDGQYTISVAHNRRRGLGVSRIEV